MLSQLLPPQNAPESQILSVDKQESLILPLHFTRRKA
jgi:hypothetical protein